MSKAKLYLTNERGIVGRAYQPDIYISLHATTTDLDFIRFKKN